MIVNCPSCSGPVFKTKSNDVDLRSLDIDIRCPHCKKTLELQIRMEIVVVVNGKRIEKLGEAKLRML